MLKLTRKPKASGKVKSCPCLILSLSTLLLPVISSAGDRQVPDHLTFIPMSLEEQGIPEFSEAGTVPQTSSGADKYFVNSLSRDDDQTAFTMPHLLETPSIDLNFGSLIDSVRAVESKGGVYAPELAEMLHSMGQYYLGRQEYDQAFSTFEREQHILRINYGLFAERQVPSVKAQINALDATRQFNETEDKYQYLLYLLEKNYGKEDIRLLPELVQYADWQLNRFHEVIRFEMSDLSFFTSGNGFTNVEDQRLHAFENLQIANDNYTRALRLMVEAEQFGEPLMYQIENRLLETALFQAARTEVSRDADSFLKDLDLRQKIKGRDEEGKLAWEVYKYGIESYERQLIYLVQDERNTLAQYVNTLLAFGDWYTLFGKMEKGRDKYRKAHSLLETYLAQDASLSQIMNPGIPVAMPVFTDTSRAIQSPEQQSGLLNGIKGYVDVSFRINRNGNARHVEVLDSSENTTRSIERHLVRTVSDTRFRPRFDEAMLASNDEVALRYYYTY